MIHKKIHKQMEIVDPWSHLSPKRRKRLESEWPGLFRKNILLELPVDELATSFDETFGAPTKELYAILGGFLLQQMKDLTDREAIDQLAFNTQWHFALNIPEESDQIKSVSEKTWWSMRQLATEKHLDQLMFDRITVKLAKAFKVNRKDQRIDSVHIKSNMRKLSRLGIFSRTIHRFLVNLKRHHRSHFDAIDKKIRSRYFKKKALDLFAMVKPSQSSKTLATAGSDLYDLIEQFKDHTAIGNMNSYKLMQRVLSDQCNVEPGPGRRVTVKKSQEISSLIKTEIVQMDPYFVRYKKRRRRYSACFDVAHCRSCSHVSQCPVQPGKKYYYLRYGSKGLRLANRRKHEATCEFKDRYRWRAGVEATMSQLGRLTGIKRQRVRGMPAVRFGSTLKAAGVNILRAAAVYKAMKRRMGACLGRTS